MITVSGKKHAWYEGMTVADLLRELDDTQLCTVVRINDTYVSQPKFEETIIPDNSEVFLVPMIAGG